MRKRDDEEWRERREAERVFWRRKYERQRTIFLFERIPALVGRSIDGSMRLAVPVEHP